MDVRKVKECTFNGGLEVEEDGGYVRWIKNTLEDVVERRPELERFVYEVRVEEGMVFYLPFGWFHEVRSEGVSVSYNFWWDGEYDLKWSLMEGVGEEI
ncbi:hypothetical protein TrVE_jg10182 [Triparma verrucosa]|nr:hypothetical protein TrVE_jg10182 [Triparma verrucosa]